MQHFSDTASAVYTWNRIKPFETGFNGYLVAGLGSFWRRSNDPETQFSNSEFKKCSKPASNLQQFSNTASVKLTSNQIKPFETRVNGYLVAGLGWFPDLLDDSRWWNWLSSLTRRCTLEHLNPCLLWVDEVFLMSIGQFPIERSPFGPIETPQMIVIQWAAAKGSFCEFAVTVSMLGKQTFAFSTSTHSANAQPPTIGSLENHFSRGIASGLSIPKELVLLIMILILIDTD